VAASAQSKLPLQPQVVDMVQSVLLTLIARQLIPVYATNTISA
jgi:hypothetical protein